MSDVPPNDNGQNTTTRGELLATSAIAQFYTFAGRCMDWAKTTPWFRRGPCMLRWL